MLSDRDRRKLLRIIKTLPNKDPNFTVKRLVAHSRLLLRHISYRTLYREVKAAGFDQYLPARKKGGFNEPLSHKKKGVCATMQEDSFHKARILLAKYCLLFRRVCSVYKTQPLSDALAHIYIYKL
jgi:hypothetical protein